MPERNWSDPATRRPGDPATRRPGDPAPRRPGDPATVGECGRGCQAEEEKRGTPGGGACKDAGLNSTITFQRNAGRRRLQASRQRGCRRGGRTDRIKHLHSPACMARHARTPTAPACLPFRQSGAGRPEMSRPNPGAARCVRRRSLRSFAGVRACRHALPPDPGPDGPRAFTPALRPPYTSGRQARPQPDGGPSSLFTRAYASGKRPSRVYFS